MPRGTTTQMLASHTPTLNTPNIYHTILRQILKGWSIYLSNQELVEFSYFCSRGYQLVSFVTLSNYFENFRQHVQNSLQMLGCHWSRLEAWQTLDQWELSSWSLLCSVNIVVSGNSGKISREIGISVAPSSMSTKIDVEFFANSWDFSVDVFLQTATNQE